MILIFKILWWWVFMNIQYFLISLLVCEYIDWNREKEVE